MWTFLDVPGPWTFGCSRAPTGGWLAERFYRYRITGVLRAFNPSFARGRVDAAWVQQLVALPVFSHTPNQDDWLNEELPSYRSRGVPRNSHQPRGRERVYEGSARLVGGKLQQGPSLGSMCTDRL